LIKYFWSYGLNKVCDIINKEEEYKVEEIREHHKKERGIQFLIYWKGYRNKYDQ